MKQVFLQKGKVQLLEVGIPTLDCNSILVKVCYSFISSGTELATISSSNKSLFHKTTSNFSKNVHKVLETIKENGFSSTLSLIGEKFGQIIPLGYSCSGKIVAVGTNVETFVVGDYVACAGTGFANHAEFVVVPKNLAVKIKNTSNLKDASLTTIGAIALQSFRRANPVLGEKICILGLGLIGQIVLQIAKSAGCQVIGVDVKDSRLNLATKLGADFVVNSTQNGLINEINWFTKKHGVDSTIITTSAQSGELIQNSMEITRRKGRVVLVGDVKIDFDRDPFYSKEIDFLISCSYGPGRYDDLYEKFGIDYPYDYVRWTENRNMEFFVQMIQDNKISINPLISAEFNLNDIENAYASLASGESLGIVLSYNSESEDAKKNLNTMESPKDNSIPGLANITKKNLCTDSDIRLCCVGVGGFAKTKILPILDKINHISVQAFVDVNPTTLVNISRMYKVTNISNDHKELLQSDIDAAIIATPHSLHADQAIDFMTSGKAVFVEKPAAVNFEQLDKLENFFANNKNFMYCVDFNRPFSPFIADIKNVLHKRNNPVMIFYRMNAGFIPREHWINSAQNGGRIIGEACHIFDLFLFLTNSNPISVSVQTINSSSNVINKTDNFFAELIMEDGSCCSLLYSAIGNSDSGKELMEIYFDGKSIIMNDFYELQGFGISQTFNKVSRTRDKGHEALFKKFFEAVKNQNYNMPVPLSRILMTTRISLIVDNLAHNGGGVQEL